MTDVVFPAVLGLFGTGLILGMLWDRYSTRRQVRYIMRWVIDVPSQAAIDDLLSKPEVAAAVLQQFRAELLAGEWETVESENAH